MPRSAVNRLIKTGKRNAPATGWDAFMSRRNMEWEEEQAEYALESASARTKWEEESRVRSLQAAYGEGGAMSIAAVNDFYQM